MQKSNISKSFFRQKDDTKIFFKKSKYILNKDCNNFYYVVTNDIFVQIKVVYEVITFVSPDHFY